MMDSSLKLVVVLVAALGMSCVSGSDESEVQQYVYTADGAKESDQFFLIPAEKVRDRVDEGYTLKTYPGPNGEEMAQLFVTANELSGGNFDGNDVEDLHVLHLAVQIEPPDDPPGRTLSEKALHFYEVAIATDSSKLAGLLSSRLGVPVNHESDLDFEFKAAAGDDLGFLDGSAPDPAGFLSKANFGPLSSLDDVVDPLFQGYFWYEGGKGLIVSEVLGEEFKDIRGSSTLGEVCGEGNSWFSENVASGCWNGWGVAFESDALTLKWSIYEDYE